MRYRISFMGDTVGQSPLQPFEVETPETLGSSARSADLCRLIRSRVVRALVAAPAPGAPDARAVVEQYTQIVVMLSAGQGAAYYGTNTLGRFDLHPIP